MRKLTPGEEKPAGSGQRAEDWKVLSSVIGGGSDLVSLRLAAPW